MNKKALAGWALICIYLSLALALLAVGGPSIDQAWTSTEGLSSQTEGQTARENEGSLTQSEKAGGNNNGKTYGGIQREPRAAAGEKDSGSCRLSGGTAAGTTGARLLPYKLAELQREANRREAIKQEPIGTLPGGSSSAEAGSGKELRSRVISRGGNSYSAGVFIITAYTAGYESTQKKPGEKGYGITATGTTAQANHTIAADWKVLQPGTRVMIEGLPYTFVVEDKGGAIRGKHIDLFISDLKAALDWGRQYREIRIIE